MMLKNTATIQYSGLSAAEEKYSYASTPWITSQFLDAAKTTTAQEVNDTSSAFLIRQENFQEN